MQLIRGWNKKTGKGKAPLQKTCGLSFLVPIIENILNHKSLILSASSQIGQTHRLVSLLRLENDFSFSI